MEGAQKKQAMNEQEHKIRHEKLHRALDELLADYLDHTGTSPSKITVLELMEWSYQQAKSPGVKPR